MLRRKKSFQTPTTPTDYPAGTFLKTEKGFFYIVSPDKRYRITTKRVLDSWSPHRVVPSTEAAVLKYRIAAKMKFRNGSLIFNLGDGKVYLIENGKRRCIVNADFFYTLGLDPSKYMKEVTWVSQEELKLHELGEDLY